MFIKPVEELTFADDFMFGAVMKHPPICKDVLEKLLHISIKRIDYPELQKKYCSLLSIPRHPPRCLRF